jgi:hypothetical protein
MPIFAAVSSAIELTDSKISELRAQIANNSLYVPSSVRVVVHHSRRAVLFEMVGFRSEIDSDGPDDASRSAVLFDGLAFRSGHSGFLTPAATRHIHADEINGMFFRAILGDDATVLVDYDPLCTVPVYHAAREGLAIVSDRPAICAAVVGDTTPDPLTATWVSTLGFAMGERTIYRAVRRAPVGGRLIAHDGVVTANNGRNVFRDHKPMDLADHVEAYRAAARTALQSVFSSDAETTIGLTGGKDSRLVLALLIDAGLQKDVTFLTSDFAPDHGGTADVIIARSIAERFGLRHNVNPRASSTTPAPEPSTLAEWLRRHAFAVSGLTSGWDKVGVEQPANAISVSGGFGEALKHAIKSTPRHPHTCLLDSMIFSIDNFRAFLPGTLATLNEDLEAEIYRYAEPGAVGSDAADIFYCSQRLPNWAGVQAAAQRHRVRAFPPLYNRAMLPLAFSTPYAEKKLTRIHHEIIRQISPELVAFPFANDRWPAELGDYSPPMPNPGPIPRHGGWQHSLAASQPVRDWMAETIERSTATWTGFIDQKKVADHVRAGELTQANLITALGLITTSFAERGEFTAFRARYP